MKLIKQVLFLFLVMSGILLSANHSVARAAEVDSVLHGQRCTSSGCYAYTQCWNGTTAHCRVFANPWTRTSCSWWVWPYRGVRCTGYDQNGSWQNIYVSCY